LSSLKRALAYILAGLVLVNLAVWFMGQRAAFLPDVGEIDGVVQDDHGVPMDGATVLASHGVYWGQVVGGLDDRETHTSGGGKFRFRGVTPGTWFVSATAPGHGAAMRLAIAVAPGRRESSDLRLRSDFVLRGVVRASSRAGSRGIAHAVVRAWEFRPKDGDGWLQTETDETGRWELDLPSAAYVVQASVPGFLSASSLASRSATLDLVLDPAAHLGGQVVDGATHQPVTYATVYAHATGLDLTWAHAVSGSDGRFAFDSLPPGEYRVDARAGKSVGLGTESIVVTEAAPRRDARVEVWPGRTVLGEVVDSRDRPIAGAVVNVRPKDFPREAGASATTDASGRFFVVGALPWPSTLRVEVDGFLEESQDVDLTGRDAKDIRLKLHPGVTLEGRIRDGRGLPVANADVEVLSTDLLASRGFTRTDDDGFYEVHGLQWSVFVEARQREHGFARSAPLDLSCGCDSKTDFLDLTLSPTGPVRGSVHDGNGRPIAGADVFASTRRGSKYPMSFDVRVTGSDGCFEFSSLPQGQWNLQASTGPGAPFELEFGKPPAKSVEVGVAPVPVDLLFPSDVPPISGRVVADGRPVAGASIRSAETPFGSISRGVSDSQGEFTIAALQDEDFGIAIVAPGFVAEGARSHGERRAGNRDRKLERATTSLRRRASIAGRVIDADGAPITDYVLEGSGIADSALIHDPSGAFVLDGLPPDNDYSLVARAPDGRVGSVHGIALTEGENRRDVTIAVADGITLTARIVDAKTGTPLSVRCSLSGSGVFLTSETSADGTLSMRRVPMGMKLRLQVELGDNITVGDSFSFTTPTSPAALDLGVLRPRSFAHNASGIPKGHVGIRAEWENGEAVVKDVWPDSPAAKAGFQEGDKLLSIGDEDPRGAGMMGIAALLVGSPGSSVEIAYVPASGGATRKVTLRREEPPPRRRK